MSRQDRGGEASTSGANAGQPAAPAAAGGAGGTAPKAAYSHRLMGMKFMQRATEMQSMQKKLERQIEHPEEQEKKKEDEVCRECCGCGAGVLRMARNSWQQACWGLVQQASCAVCALACMVGSSGLPVAMFKHLVLHPRSTLLPATPTVPPRRIGWRRITPQAQQRCCMEPGSRTLARAHCLCLLLQSQTPPPVPAVQCTQAHWVAPQRSAGKKRCRVIMEADPWPDGIGRASFKNFNPAIEALASGQPAPMPSSQQPAAAAAASRGASGGGGSGGGGDRQADVAVSDAAMADRLGAHSGQAGKKRPLEAVDSSVTSFRMQKKQQQRRPGR